MEALEENHREIRDWEVSYGVSYTRFLLMEIPKKSMKCAMENNICFLEVLEITFGCEK